MQTRMLPDRLMRLAASCSSVSFLCVSVNPPGGVVKGLSRRGKL